MTDVTPPSTPDPENDNPFDPSWRLGPEFDQLTEEALAAQPEKPVYVRRPSFSIEFQFTDFSPNGDLDREALAEACFNALCAGEGDLEPMNYSCDGYDVLRSDD